MRQCPACQVDLETTDIEGYRVERCPSCHGHLVPTLNLSAIKRSCRTSEDELRSRASSDFKGSISETIICPLCKCRMSKQRMSSPLDMELDVCDSCDRVWLDGGEIAMVQLACEARHPSAEASEMQRRSAQFEADPARVDRFKRNCSLLEEGPSSLIDVVGRALGDGAMIALRIMFRF